MKLLNFSVKFENDGKSKRVAAPPVTSSNQALFPLLRRYQSYKEYTVDFMLPLLLHETWETVSRFLTESSFVLS
ncbi:hypothetical protein DPMN_178219 [Dreissena polymorpha]|uniref:Uncharacterized protein n=1 Tax=Dreissena polymorpha TaxID=45954 RepID=A0A9D4EDQ3_DREPO|nr:hypothetical protein DPMN_178219 [Dreissena polymorpha]